MLIGQISLNPIFITVPLSYRHNVSPLEFLDWPTKKAFIDVSANIFTIKKRQTKNNDRLFSILKSPI